MRPLFVLWLCASSWLAIADPSLLEPPRDSRVGFALSATEGDYYSLGAALELGVTPEWAILAGVDVVQLEPGVRAQAGLAGVSWARNGSEVGLLGQAYHQGEIQGYGARGFAQLDSLELVGWSSGFVFGTMGWLTFPGTAASLNQWQASIGLGWNWSPDWFVSAAWTHWFYTPALAADLTLAGQLGFSGDSLSALVTQWLERMGELRVGTVRDTSSFSFAYSWGRTAVLSSTVHQWHGTATFLLGQSWVLDTVLGYSLLRDATAQDSAASLSLSIQYIW